MTFAPTSTLGTALVVPCRADGDQVALAAEADALWGAEDDKPIVTGKIAASWGSVGALFPPSAPADQIAAWTAYFQQCKATPLAAVRADGLLAIAWPTRVDGRPLACDVLLATTNRETPAVRPEEAANAWIAKPNGEYFFENVRAGIRTPDDERIWRRMAANSAWLGSQTPHAATIAQLRHEYPGT